MMYDGNRRIHCPVIIFRAVWERLIRSRFIYNVRKIVYWPPRALPVNIGLLLSNTQSQSIGYVYQFISRVRIPAGNQTLDLLPNIPFPYQLENRCWEMRRTSVYPIKSYLHSRNP